MMLKSNYGPLRFFSHSFFDTAVGRFIRITASATYRFYWDDCFSRAAALAYSTLFSLVPFIALCLSLFTAFRIDEQQGYFYLKSFLEQILPPIESGELQKFHEEIFSYIQTFTSNVAALNTVSVLLLIVSSVALLNTIESALNVIWRVSSNATYLAKIINFWAVITLGPLLMALSIYYTTSFRTLAGSHIHLGTRWFSLLTLAIPIGVSWAALTLLFYKMPAARVRLRDALMGAGVGAVMFEFVKYAFAYYLTLSSTYSTIYGVVASVPLFLFWLYIAWVVVLLGAEIAFQAGSIYLHDTKRKYATDLGEVGALLGLRILSVIGANFLNGERAPTESEIALETGSDPELVRTCLDLLADANLLTVADQETHSRTLLVSPDRLTLRQIFETFLTKEARKGGVPALKAPLVESFIGDAGQGAVGFAEWTLEEFLARRSGSN